MVSGIIVLFHTLLLLCFTSTAMADEAVSLKLGYLLLSPSGEVAAEVGGIGTKVDLETDLDLDDSSGIMAEAALAFGDVKLTVGYLPLSFDGNSLLSRSVVFDGTLYPVGTQVDSSLDVNILDVGLTWFIINLDDVPTRFQLGVELGVKVADAETSITESLTSATEEASETLPIPTLGLRARVAFSDFVGVSGRVGYLGYSGNHFLDADIQLEVSPLPFAGIFAGYRYIDLAIDESDVFVDTQLSGFYGGAFVRF